VCGKMRVSAVVECQGQAALAFPVRRSTGTEIEAVVCFAPCGRGEGSRGSAFCSLIGANSCGLVGLPPQVPPVAPRKRLLSSVVVKVRGRGV